MRTAVNPLLLLLVLAMAGCAAKSRPRAHVPDWESEDYVRPPPSQLVAVPKVETAPQRAQPNAQPHQTWVALNRWCNENGLPAPSQLGASSYALSTTGGVFVLTAGSQLAQWDGVQIRLGFAPQLIDRQPFVHALDLQKSIAPLLEPMPNVLASGSERFDAGSRPPVIVIDAGHGGQDSGTSSVLAGGYEKEFTLDWARRLGVLLRTGGWTVVFTRTNDAELSLSNRVRIAEQQNAELFLSLHFNSAAPNEAEAGLETYCLTPTGMPSTVTRGYSDELTFAFPNNAFDAQNLQLAAHIHRELLQVNGRLDRGVRRARFLAVLRGQRCPAVLIEGGYLSNPREARLIAEAGYRQKLAEAVAKALGMSAQIAASQPDSPP